jgi:hypothetical protein
MAEGHDIKGPDSARWHSRRSVLGAAAAVGILGPAAPAILATRAGERQPDSEGQLDGRPAEAAPERAASAPVPAVPAARGGSDLWGTSASGHGAGVRGNGRWGVIGEGTHTGVSGAGFVGVRGSTSIVQGGEAGVGVWAQAAVPGSTALRADGPSEFNGVTTFSRSGVVTVRRGSGRVTVPGVQLTADTAILATLQNRVTGLFLHAVETDVAKGSFTIFLNTAPDRDVRIGWFALG